MLSAPAASPLRLLTALFLILCPGLLHAVPRISEFMADNNTGLRDEDGEFRDWVEIENTGESPVALAGYSLTDDATRPRKWVFPAVTLEPNSRLVVFASGKNRTTPGANLHTNFQLDSDGEYLALFAPDGTTRLSEFAPAFPPQFPDQSYGLGRAGSSGTVNLTPGWTHPGNYASIYITGTRTSSERPGADNLDLAMAGSSTQVYMWFDFSSRLGQLPPGSTVTSATLAWRGVVSPSVIGTPAVPSALGIFTVPDDRKGVDTVATGTTGNELVNYYAANTPAASFNAVPGQSPQATWDIASLVQQWVNNPTAPRRGQLMILNSAHPMHMDWNVDATNNPQLTLNVTVQTDPNAPPALSFFPTPTPGQPNGAGNRAGPVIANFTKNPPQPVTGPLVITAELRPTNSPVAAGTVFYRRMFDAESQVPLKDDGTGGDATAGDGIWSATLPASAFSPGQMTRWRFVANDSAGSETREPPYPDPLNSHQYYGTVADDPRVQTKLPVIHWFTQNPAGAGTDAGSRGSVYYRGEFYDNVLFNIHGQSTRGFPKKSYNIDFNRTQRFRWSPDAPRVADIDLLTNWADKSKVRHVLAYEIMRESGVHAHFAFTVRVQQNGAFFSTADMVEDADEIYLRRAGLNEDGALYKAYSNNLTGSASTGFEKKTRKSENNSDLQGLINGLAQSGAALSNYVYDNIDIPKTVNLLAANSVIRNIDMHSKNWYAYRDTGRTDRWTMLPWDLDLSQGRVWNSQNTYFDNNLYVDGYVATGTSIRLPGVLFSLPETRAMIMRRIRTLIDRFLQSPDTPVAERYYERRLDEQLALIDSPDFAKSDAQLDFEKWGSWRHGNGGQLAYTDPDPSVESMARAVQRFRNEYLPGRRNYIYNTQIVGRGGEIPLPQTGGRPVQYTPLVRTGAPAKVLVPTNGNLGVTWIGIPSMEPFDTTSWRSGTTGVGYERGTGYETLIGTDVGEQMRVNNSVYVRVEFDVQNPSAIEILELRMKYDDGFIAFLNGAVVASANAPASPQWNSAATGLHEADAVTFDIYDITDKKLNLRQGRNVLAIHGLNDSVGSSDMIVLPELHAGALGPPVDGEPVITFASLDFSPVSGNQDEEFIELRNGNSIAVDVSRWKLTGAVEHTFEPGTVIPPGRSLYVSPNLVAFRNRAASPKGGEGRFVQGNYRGHLSSLGETLTLLDAKGAVNNTFTYEGRPTDAQLHLVISEIMYHPRGDGLAEYIELLNISRTKTLSLEGVRFTEGIEFNFTGSAVTSLAPGQRVLVVRDRAAFEAAYGTTLPVAGVFANGTALNNGGESIKLEDRENNTVRQFSYSNTAPWPLEPAGQGFSLVLKKPHTNPDHGRADSWRASVSVGGAAGTSDAASLPANPIADANGNGVADLIDYALGVAPGRQPVGVATEMRSYEVNGVPTLMPTLTYPVDLGADEASLRVLLSADLAAWVDGAEHLELVSVSRLGDGRALVTQRIKSDIGSQGRIFWRLQAETAAP